MANNIKTYFNVASCLLIQLLCSNFNLWSTINVYVYSYLKEADSSLQMSDMNQIFVWIILASNTGIQFGLQAAYKFGFRATILISGILTAAFIFVASYTQNFLIFTVTFGIASLFFAGATFLISFDRMFKLFPKSNEIACGVVNISYGLGLFGQGETSFLLVNPDNEPLVENEDYYPTSVTKNVPSALRTVAIIYLVISVLAGVLYCNSSYIEHPLSNRKIKEGKGYNSQSRANSFAANIENYKDDDQLLEGGLIDLSDDESAISSEDGKTEQFTSLRQALISWLGLKVFFLLFGVGCFGIFMVSNYQPYGQQYIIDPSFLTLVGTVSGLVAGISGIFWAFTMTKVHYKYIVFVMLLASSICAFSVPFFSSDKIPFFLLTNAASLFFGGYFTVLPIMVVNLFGGKIGTRAIGYFYQSNTLASICSYLFTKYIDWTPIFYIYSSICFLSIFLIFMIFTKKTKQVKF